MSDLFLAIEQRDLPALEKLARSQSRLTQPNAKGQEPLPCAARAGWAQGVKALLAAGADPNRPDKDQSGINQLARPPLCEALSLDRAEAAAALLEGGAVVAGNDRELLWAFAFLGRRAGWSVALDLFEPMEALGFDPVGSPISSGWLFLGSGLASGVKSELDRERMDAWLNAKINNVEQSPLLGDCAWHLIFGAAGQGWCPEGVARALALSHDEAKNPGSHKESRALMALEWGLEKADETLSRICAEALVTLGKQTQAPAAFVKAAKGRPDDRLFGDKEFALRQARCARIAQAICFPSDARLPAGRAEAMGAAAYDSGQAGLVLAALEAGMPPAKILQARRELSSSYSTSDWTHPARELSALFAAVAMLESSGAQAARSFWRAYDPRLTHSESSDGLDRRMADTEQESVRRAVPEPRAAGSSKIRI